MINTHTRGRQHISSHRSADCRRTSPKSECGDYIYKYQHTHTIAHFLFFPARVCLIHIYNRSTRNSASLGTYLADCACVTGTCAAYDATYTIYASALARNGHSRTRALSLSHSTHTTAYNHTLTLFVCRLCNISALFTFSNALSLSHSLAATHITHTLYTVTPKGACGRPILAPTRKRFAAGNHHDP